MFVFLFVMATCSNISDFYIFNKNASSSDFEVGPYDFMKSNFWENFSLNELFYRFSLLFLRKPLIILIIPQKLPDHSQDFLAKTKLSLKFVFRDFLTLTLFSELFDQVSSTRRNIERIFLPNIVDFIRGLVRIFWLKSLIF